MTMAERFRFVSHLFVDSRTHSGVPNKNTMKNTKWAVNTWNDWVAARNRARLLGQPMFPTAINLQSATPQQVDEYLSYFVLEVRNKDGQLYPRETLYNLICGLARYMKMALLRSDLNFLSVENVHFSRFRKVFKSQLKLTKNVVTVKHKHTESITQEQEAMLWKKGILNIHTSIGLSKVVYFYNCKFFELYSREEHRSLMTEQYTFGSDHEGPYIQFRRTESQRRPNVLNTIRHRYTASDCSVYNVFKKYLDCIGVDGYFYRRPSVWDQGLIYERPLGLHVLSTYMATIMKEAGFNGVYTGVSVKGLNQHEAYLASSNSLYLQRQAVQMGMISPSAGPESLSKNHKIDQTAIEDKINNEPTCTLSRKDHLNCDTGPESSRQDHDTLGGLKQGSKDSLENQENYVHKKLRFWEYKSKYVEINSVGKGLKSDKFCEKD